MRPLQDYLRPAAAATGVLRKATVILSLVAVLVSWGALKERARHLELQANNATLFAAQKPRVTPALSRADREAAARLTQLKQERQFPWHLLFQAVERSGNDEVELLEFHPDKGSHKILLGGFAKNSMALVRYIDQLDAQPSLHTVYLVQQSIVTENGTARIAFKIRASLRKR